MKKKILKIFAVTSICLFVSCIVSVTACFCVVFKNSKSIKKLNEKNNENLQNFRTEQLRILDESFEKGEISDEQYKVKIKDLEQNYEEKFYQTQASEQDKKNYNDLNRTQKSMRDLAIASLVMTSVSYVAGYGSSEKLCKNENLNVQEKSL